ncbi:MAG: PilN domain-containing protein [Deltaproteobacteria bacterium]|jgi:Tfp pilus assembly protein PilN|nr:PilN domain-containing protein [Deltaproteobacteria bacterium]
MIKINLLPLESFRQTASGQLSVTIFVVCLMFIGGGLYVFNKLYMAPRMASLQATKSETNQKLDNIKAASSKALKQTTDFVEQMVQVSTISGLEERRRDQARLFMALSGEINNQTSWLVSVTHADNALAIKGMAIDNPTVGALLTRLQSQDLLRNVELQQVTGTTLNGLPLVSFDIKAETAFPEATLVEQGLPDIQLPDSEQIKKLVTAISPDLATALDRNKQVGKAL